MFGAETAPINRRTTRLTDDRDEVNTLAVTLHALKLDTAAFDYATTSRCGARRAADAHLRRWSRATVKA